MLNLQVALPGWGERAAFLSAAQTPVEQRKVLDSVWEGRVDLLYVSPERLRNPGVLRLLRHRRPALWVLDEAHTFSQWGMDFRPDFLRLARAIREIHEGDEAPLLGLVTATATHRVAADLEGKLVTVLGDVLKRPMRRIPQDIEFQWRAEIHTEVERLPRTERLAAIRQRLQATRGEGVAIVYVQSRKLAESYAEQLEKAGFRAAAFHARVLSGTKQLVLQAFKEGELEVVVATSAFGMGIDRAGIHSVYHAGPPSTPESYLQEIGRVARKTGERGRAVLFWDEQDFQFAFDFERQNRVGNEKNLKDVWHLVRNRLKEAPPARWVSSFEFAHALSQDDPEDLVTQARVALYALEAFDLVREGEKQPARLHLRVLQSDEPPGVEGAPLLAHLRKRGAKPGEELELDVRETALLASLRPSKVVTAARQLVKTGHAAWSYPVTLRARYGGRKALDVAAASLRAFLAHLAEHEDVDLSRIHLQAVEADLVRRNKTARLVTAFRAIAALGIARTRRDAFTGHLVPNEHAPLKEWTSEAEQRMRGLRALGDDVLAALNEQAEGGVVTLNAVELDARYGDALDGLNAIEGLLALAQLGVIDVARGDSEQGGVFYLERGGTPKYSRKAYEPLSAHYADRARRLHAMRHILLQPGEVERVRIIRDYFTLTLSEFCERHFQDPEAASMPQLPEYQHRILDELSDTQRRVVTDDESRAILVLAGPGSGKTRTVVHRVANLVVLRGVPADRVLVLAYNRTAAAEVRERLAALIGPLGVHVDVLTFHGLARKLTGLTDGDAVDTTGRKLTGDAAHAWLLEQAITHLDETPAPYQYVLVDEYQDVDDLKYRLVTRLARFNAASGDTAEGEDDREQPGYLVAVGDDDQNLYGFQGADISFIRRFQSDYAITDENVVLLVDNYRSRPHLVETANAFMASSLSIEQRLKNADQQVRSVRTDMLGEVFFGRYTRRYHAALAVAQEARRLVDTGTPPHEIAVLARQWTHLEEVQHTLREVGLACQHYEVDDQLRPARSLVGQRVLQELLRTPDALSEHVPTTLETVRTLLGLSGEDASWPALLAAVHDQWNLTFESIALRLESARPLARGGVVLSTYHTAKGSEFTAVFVLDEREFEVTDDDTRALYVALTRAKEQLYLLRNVHACHPTFKATTFMLRLQQLGVKPLLIPTNAPLPEVIEYQLRATPGDLYLSAPVLLSQEGRDAVEHYARRWGELSLSDLRVRTAGGCVAQFVRPRSDRQNKLFTQLQRLLQGGARIQLHGQTVMHVPRDDEWYARAGYSGPETHHHVVVPSIRVRRNLG
ncbi:UvrD-helicase domain-containing protein [Deinococcus peraridilitoris]|uniref:UvrD-helicase domain-containing protein n=1 Tax=Deinococcus peraridilitoris TaxID=432329 RepID=UPI00031C2714|nr:UvrD-helicase domain-containing protein [Deinococcus peraridilitoris]